MPRTDKKSLLAGAMLALAAFIWGVAFVAQSEGLVFTGPFTFNGCRLLLGGCVLLPVIAVLGCLDAGAAALSPAQKAMRKKNTVRGGVCCGFCLFCGSMLQQSGLQYTTAGKAGFITSLYIIFVPVTGLLFGRRVARRVWLSVMIAAAGMYLLCAVEGITSVGRGELLVLAGAVGFTFHILAIDRFSPGADGVALSSIQFFTAGTLAVIGALLFEAPAFSDIYAARYPLLYMGILSCGVAYTLQVVAQKNVEPTIAVLIMSLESVFSALAGWVILNQRMSSREILGCVLVFSAVVLAQLPSRNTVK